MSDEASKAVLITGCSTGIGRATAERLAGKGWTVYATARKAGDIEDLKAKGCKTLALDVTEEESMKKAVDAVVEAEGAVGVLVNNAGYSQSGAVETLPMDSIRRQFETNVFGLIRMCQLALPSMRAQGSGRIVNISSMGGKIVFPGGGIYHATKFSVEALSDALRFEVAGFGVQVVVIEPGLITTEFGGTASASVGETDAHTDGPYGDFNRTVAAASVSAYEQGPLRRLGGPPEAVAKKIETAIASRSPRPRYKVTPSATLLIANRRLLGDRLWDRAMKGQFPQPASGR